MTFRINKISFAFLIVAILALTGCNSKLEINSDTNNEKLSGRFSMEAIDTSSWKTYTSNKYNFSIKYPGELQVDEGILLKGTSSEYYSIGFSKGIEYGFMAIAPDSTYGSRGVEEAKSYEQIIDGKKALIEEWQIGDGGSTINLKFLDPIDKWKMCDKSEFCEHITFVGQQRSDSEIFKEMISTIKFL